MGRQEGRPYRVLPHPVVPGEFTIVPKEVADRGPLRDHSEVVGRKSDGGPFASTYAARKALEERGMTGTHVVVPASALLGERIKGFLGIGVGGEDAVASPLNGNRSVGSDDASVRPKVGGATIADGIGSADRIYLGDEELGHFHSSGRDENGVSRNISSSRASSGKSAVDETGASYTEGGEELAGESPDVGGEPDATGNYGAKGGGSLGAMRRMEFEAAEYHGTVDNAVKSRGPVNGQDALDLSVQVKPTSPRRVGIDYGTGDFVIFDRTIDNVYHGHVRAWKDLHPDMQKALQQSGMADRRGNILGSD